MPSESDLESFGAAFLQWETVGTGFTHGYRTHRSVDSSLVSLAVDSLDITRPAASYKEAVAIAGDIDRGTAEMLGTSIAPLVWWSFQSDYRTRRGRTYACGLTRDEVDDSDMMRLTSDSRRNLALIFAGLIPIVLSVAGAQLVHLRTRALGEPLVPAIPYPLTGASMGAVLCGTQRRRSRPLTTFGG